MIQPCHGLLDSFAHWMANSEKNIMWLLIRTTFHIWMNMKIWLRNGLILQVQTEIPRFSMHRCFRCIDLIGESTSKPLIRIQMTDMNLLFSQFLSFHYELPVKNLRYFSKKDSEHCARVRLRVWTFTSLISSSIKCVMNRDTRIKFGQRSSKLLFLKSFMKLGFLGLFEAGISSNEQNPN